MEKKNPQNIINKYLRYLKLERNYSPNTILAYEHDIDYLLRFCASRNTDAAELSLADLQDFSRQLAKDGIKPKSQARIISGVRSFYRYLVLDGDIEDDPSELLSLPQTGTRLPQVLTVEEVDELEDSIDLSKPEGHRNRAIIEVLFSCGLRVSELVNLKLSDIHPDEKTARIIGKGNKERLVPISDSALHELRLWYDCRMHLKIQRGEEDYVFLNRRGARLTRTMILIIIKRQAAEAGITKTISPHTLRHSFATEMLKRGAGLRFIQAMLGHEDIGTTELYTHIDNVMLREEILLHHPRNLHANERNKCNDNGKTTV
ncbi:MAG: tyrosine recombinase XerD [Prevotella sp.]|nr:tyrosine recombinase XerD [Prevotella sp.]